MVMVLPANAVARFKLLMEKLEKRRFGFHVFNVGISTTTWSYLGLSVRNYTPHSVRIS